MVINEELNINIVLAQLNSVKLWLSSSPVFIAQVFIKPFKIEMDASGIGHRVCYLYLSLLFFVFFTSLSSTKHVRAALNMRPWHCFSHSNMLKSTLVAVHPPWLYTPYIILLSFSTVCATQPLFMRCFFFFIIKKPTVMLKIVLFWFPFECYALCFCVRWFCRWWVSFSSRNV